VNVSRRWLEDLLSRPLDAHQVAELMTARCCPVDGVVPLHRDLGDVRIARVAEVRKHPDADRLSLCMVDAGTGTLLEVVCGAANVTAGRTYPFAPVGAVLPGGLKLERRKIRGVESNGMLCSAKELGLGADHDGILELNTDLPPGSPFLDALPIADDQILLEVYANRPDLLCHKGVAREVAAAVGGTVKLPAMTVPSGAVAALDRAPARRADRGIVDGVEVRLEDPEGAPRYMIAVIRGVNVGPSPAWLARRLEAIGQRSINNVVDATNYVLFEVNQPLHAFDLARLRGPAVVVRRAKASEPIVTLDGVSRKLTAEMTAICDAERPTIVAGVMGSAESEVSSTTTDVVLECAYFQPTRIRRTRRALGLSSESSYRFERGIDMLAMPDALRRAVEVIIAVAGGSVREAALDLWPEPVQPRTVFVRPERVARLLGVPLPRPEVERLLASVGFVAAPKDDRMAVQVPGWRPDVTREVDLAEEVARLHGYDNLPDELRPYRASSVPDAPREIAVGRLRRHLVQGGLLEARTLPFGPADGSDAVAVLNPLSAEDRHLRRHLLPGLVRRVEHNWANRTRDVRLFEVGTVFRGGGEGQAPDESLALAIVLTGARHPPHWSDGAPMPDMDIWDLKYQFESAVAAAWPGARVRASDDGRGWQAVGSDGAVVGLAGPLDADRPVWAAPLLGFEVRVAEHPPAASAYQPLPVSPALERDVALVVPDGTTSEAVEATLRGRLGPLLERVALFDQYRGPGIQAGARSLAWHLTFRAPDRTLREKEVDALMKDALDALKATGVRQREG
jgi:phenylalanyl-tRNA synthetase beta chain